MPKWRCGGCTVPTGERESLFAFGRRLVRRDFPSDPRFTEQLMTHLHLCDYDVLTAKHVLLAVFELLASLPEKALEEARALGFRDGELLMALLREAHGVGRGMMAGAVPYVAPAHGLEAPQPQPLEGLARSLSLPELRAATREAMLAKISEREAAWRAAREPRIAAWQAEHAAFAADEESTLERMDALATLGADAFDMEKRDVGRLTDGECDVGALVSLRALVCELERVRKWQARHAALFRDEPQPHAAMEAALADAEAEPLSPRLDLVRALRSRAANSAAWQRRAAALLVEPCELRDLQELVRDAEVLSLDSDEVRAARLRAADAKRWIGRIHSDLLRRASARGKAVTRLTLAEATALVAEATSLRLVAPEIGLAEERLSEAHEWRRASAAHVASSDGGRPPSLDAERMAQIEELLKEAEVLNIAFDEVPLLEQRANEAKRWLAAAREALAGDTGATDLVDLMSEGSKLGLAFDELQQLATVLDAHEFGEQAQRALDELSTVEVLETLAKQADDRVNEGSGGVKEFAEALRVKAGVARGLAARIGPTLDKRPSLRDAASLLLEVEAALVDVPGLSRLRDAVARARTWQEGPRRVLAKSTRNAASRPSLFEVEEMLRAGLELPIAMPECVHIDAHVREAKDILSRAETALAEAGAAELDEVLRSESGVAGEAMQKAATAVAAAPDTDAASVSADDGEEREASLLRVAAAQMVAPLQKMLEQVERLPLLLTATAHIRVRAWRLRLRSSKGGPLSTLADLVTEGRKLGLTAQVRADATPAAVGGSDADTTGKAEAHEEGMPTSAGCAAEGEERAAEERSAAAREHAELAALVNRATRWSSDVEKVLNESDLPLDALEALLAGGANLSVELSVREALQARIESGTRWQAAADEALGRMCTLTEVRKLIRDYARLGVLSATSEEISKRGKDAEQWIERAEELFKQSGINLPELSRVLESDGAELYCVCRQPDDLQRLMLACDSCELWFHSQCMGVSPAQAKALSATESEFECASCAAKRGAPYKYTMRCKAAKPKFPPRFADAQALLADGDRLRVHVEEVDLLRAAVGNCSEWQKGAARRLHEALERAPADVPKWQRAPEDLLASLFEEAETLRVQPALLSLLKGWRLLRQVAEVRMEAAAAEAAAAATAEKAAAAVEVEPTPGELSPKESPQQALPVEVAPTASAVEAVAAALAEAPDTVEAAPSQPKSLVPAATSAGSTGLGAARAAAGDAGG